MILREAVRLWRRRVEGTNGEAGALMPQGLIDGVKSATRLGLDSFSGCGGFCGDPAVDFRRTQNPLRPLVASIQMTAGEALMTSEASSGRVAQLAEQLTLNQ